MKTILLLFSFLSIYYNCTAQKKLAYCFAEETDSIQRIYRDTILTRVNIFYNDGSKKGIVYFNKKGYNKKAICYYPNGKKRAITRWKHNIVSSRDKRISVLFNEKGRRTKKNISIPEFQYPPAR